MFKSVTKIPRSDPTQERERDLPTHTRLVPGATIHLELVWNLSHYVLRCAKVSECPALWWGGFTLLIHSSSLNAVLSCIYLYGGGGGHNAIAAQPRHTEQACKTAHLVYVNYHMKAECKNNSRKQRDRSILLALAFTFGYFSNLFINRDNILYNFI